MKNFKPGDIIVYKTNSTHFLTAILRITRRFESHDEAANWLTANSYDLPSNNINSAPLSLGESHALGYMSSVGKGARLDATVHKKWNGEYIFRALDPRSSYFFTTESIYNAVQARLTEPFVPIGPFLRDQLGSIPKTNWQPAELPDQTLKAMLQVINPDQ